MTAAAVAAVAAVIGLSAVLIVQTRAKADLARSLARETAAKDVALAKEAETQAVLGFVQDRVFAAARPEGQAGGLGRDVSLRRALEAALPFVDQGFGEQPLIEARLRMAMGTSFYFLGEAKIAAEQWDKARSLYTSQRGADHRDTLKSMDNLATAYAALGRQADALKLREESVELERAKLGPDDPDTLGAMNNLAASYASLGRHADALKLLEETLALEKTKLGPEHPETLRSLYNMARRLCCPRPDCRGPRAPRKNVGTTEVHTRTRPPRHPLEHDQLGRHLRDPRPTR